ncbi:PEG3 [Acrasis kona]|uniref:PEG3 n=1 Tax=Acrasis kona TaxID=1008807 RepID=A0AAW2ZFD6_9EUKA
MEASFGDVVFILSAAHNKYITIERNGEMECTRKYAGDFEAVTLCGGEEGTKVMFGERISLRSAHNKYISSPISGQMLANRDIPSELETFRIIHATAVDAVDAVKFDAPIKFVTNSKKHLVADPDGGIKAQKEECEYQWDFFIILRSYDAMQTRSRSIALKAQATSPNPFDIEFASTEQNDSDGMAQYDFTQGMVDLSFFREREPTQNHITNPTAKTIRELAEERQNKQISPILRQHSSNINGSNYIYAHDKQTSHIREPSVDSYYSPSSETSVNPFDDPFADFLFTEQSTVQQVSNQDWIEEQSAPPHVKEKQPNPPSDPSYILVSPAKPPPLANIVTKTKASPKSPASTKRRFELRLGVQPDSFSMIKVGVFNEENQVIYRVVMRLGSRTEINDADNKPVALITREALHLHNTFVITTRKGRIGVCKQRFKFVEKKFNYEVQSSKQYIKMVGDFDNAFIINKNEKQIGSLQMRTKGCVLNLECLSVDVFHIICQCICVLEQKKLESNPINK